MAWRSLAFALMASLASSLCAAPASMNPDISLSGLFLYDNLAGLGVQEIELQASSDIDPYLRGSVMFSFAPDPLTKEFGADVEEAYVDTLDLPALTLRAGKFKAALGKENGLHTHALPFLDAPLANTALLGDEGFNDVGLSASLLVPLPWFVEVTAQAFDSANSELFASPVSGDLAGLGALKTLLELGDNATLEAMFSGAGGRNATEDITDIENMALTYKWRPNEARALVLGGEWMRRNVAFTAGQETRRGIAAWLQFQFARRWWIEGRFDTLAHAELISPDTRKSSALLAYVPSEFSAYRLQYDWIESQVNAPEHKISLQLNFAMGVHPAHSY